MAGQTETGTQLLARLGTRPSLSGLEAALFGNQGPGPGSIVEFVGEEGTGKTQAVQHLIANAVLPKTWKGIEFKGQEVGVILIDTEYHFCLLRFAAILENRVNYTIKTIHDNVDSLSEGDVDTLIKECLQRLLVMRCNSTTQLILSLYSLDTVLSCKLDIALLVLDSASAFYWIDRGQTNDNPSAKNSLQQQKLTALQHLIKNFGIFVVITRASIFAGKPREGLEADGKTSYRTQEDQWNYLGHQWQKAVSCTYYFSADSCSYDRSLMNVSFTPVGGQCVIKRQFSVTDYGVSFVAV